MSESLFDYSTLPDELKRHRWFSLYRLDKGHGDKLGKYPCNVDGYQKTAYADSMSFDQIMKIYQNWRYREVGGIGITLDPKYRIACADIDLCNFTPETLDQIDNKIRRFLDLMDSYTEISVSFGFHVFASYEKLPRLPNGHADNVSWLEVYTRRFIALTGLPAYPEWSDRGHYSNRVEGRTAKLRQIVEHSFPDKPKPEPGLLPPVLSSEPMSSFEIGLRRETLRNERDGKFIRAMMDRGDLSKYNGDWSKCAVWLLGKLAFYFGNRPDLIRDEFERGAMANNEHWNRKYGNRIWSTYHIDLAIRNCTKEYDPFYRSNRSYSPHLALKRNTK